MSELTREQVEHCKDCCCARSWNALGITTFTGSSIPDHIAALRAQLHTQTERAERAEAGIVAWQSQYRLQSKQLADLTAKLEAMTERVKYLEEWKRIVTGTGTDQEAVIRFAATEYTKTAVQCWKDKVAELEQQLAASEQELKICKERKDMAYKEVEMQLLKLSASEQRFTDAENERIEWVRRGERAEEQLVDLTSRVNSLAAWIMANVPGEPSWDAGACEAAISIMSRWQAMIARLENESELERQEKIYWQFKHSLVPTWMLECIARNLDTAEIQRRMDERDQLQATVLSYQEAVRPYTKDELISCDTVRGVCHRLQATITAQAEEIGRLREAAHNLLDAMHEADHAKGFDEKQDARWSCMTMRDALRQALASEKEGA